VTKRQQKRSQLFSFGRPYFQWARQDQNTSPVSAKKRQNGMKGAAKSAAGLACPFAAAIAAIVTLPLTEAEKADAVRKLLGREQV
jgi:hypothetical protein